MEPLKLVVYLRKTGNILEKITPFRGDRVTVIDAGNELG
jgi:hypothetical protein